MKKPRRKKPCATRQTVFRDHEIMGAVRPAYETEEEITEEKESEDDDDMDAAKFKELWIEMRKDLQDNDSSQYSEEARQWAVDNGIIQGGSSEEFNGMWEDVMTREQLVTVLYRFAKLLGKA